MNSKKLHKILLIILSFSGLVFSLRQSLYYEFDFSNKLISQSIFLFIGILILFIGSVLNMSKLFSWQFLPSLLLFIIPFIFLSHINFFSISKDIVIDCLKYIFIGWLSCLAINKSLHLFLKYLLILAVSFLYWIILLLSAKYADMIIISAFLTCFSFLLSPKQLPKWFQLGLSILIAIFATGLFIGNKNIPIVFEKNIAKVVFNNTTGKGIKEHLLTDALLSNNEPSHFTLLTAVELFGITSFIVMLCLIIILFISISYHHFKQKNKNSLIIFFLGLSLIFQACFHFLGNLFSLIWLQFPLPLLSGESLNIISTLFAFSLMFNLYKPFTEDIKEEL